MYASLSRINIQYN